VKEITLAVNLTVGVSKLFTCTTVSSAFKIIVKAVHEDDHLDTMIIF